MTTNNRAFTLVELAIVITIIGLLIGGVLKGQELLENARMTSTAAQMQNYDAGTMTFRDIYKALPGDIRDPQNFIEGCTTSPCNITGDANGAIGIMNNFGFSGGLSDENNNYWLHLAKARVISGVDPNSTWTSGTYLAAAASPPSIKMGGRVTIVRLDTAWNAMAAPSGHCYHTLPAQSPSCAAVIKYDLKVDDGKPHTGTVLLQPTFAVAVDGVSYDPNVTGNCEIVIRTGF